MSVAAAVRGLVPPRVARAMGLAVACVVAAALIAGGAYRELPHPQPLEELSYYPSGQHLRPATLGFSEAAADLAWLRAVQYYGEHRRTDNRFDHMRHIFDILTSLAPRFEPAYVFGAFALAQEGRDFAGAEQLMKKGIEANPTSGELAFELGFLYYVRPGGRSLREAALYFEQSARQPDAPPQAARFAAFARQNAGQLHVAFELWAHVARNSPNRVLREAAAREMQRIEAAIRQGRAEIAVKRLTTPQVLLTEP